LQSFLLGPDAQRTGDFSQGIAQAEINAFDIQLSGLNFGKVQDVVDQRQQGDGGTLHHVEILALLRGEVASESEFRHPMMPFMGVRISWLMLARNSLLAR